MGLLERIQENEGQEAAQRVSSSHSRQPNQITLRHRGVAYLISVPTSMSEVDLVLRETFQEAHGQEPTDADMRELETLLARACTTPLQ